MRYHVPSYTVWLKSKIDIKEPHVLTTIQQKVGSELNAMFLLFSYRGASSCVSAQDFSGNSISAEAVNLHSGTYIFSYMHLALDDGLSFSKCFSAKFSQTLHWSAYLYQ